MTFMRTSFTFALLAAATLGQGLDPAKLTQPPTDSWPTYNGDYSGRRFSPLSKVNASNVDSLSLAWVYRINTGGGFGGAIKATPLVVDGIMYFTIPDHVWAIDARTGEVVGSSRFHGYDAARSEVEIGWTFLARSRWGGTHNREMKDRMLHHAFRFVQNVVFLVDPENLRSRRAIEKIGAVAIGSRPDGDRMSIAYQIAASTFAQAR